MKFFAVAAFAATVAAHAYGTGVEACSVQTVTETVTLPYHTPIAPSAPSAAPTLPPYPTGQAPYPSVPAPSGTGVPQPSAPAGTAPAGTGAASPSGTGAYPVAPSGGYFEGAASGNQVAGFVAGVGALAAFFL